MNILTKIFLFTLIFFVSFLAYGIHDENAMFHHKEKIETKLDSMQEMKEMAEDAGGY